VESPEPAIEGGASFPREDADGVSLERGGTAFRIGLNTSAVASEAGEGRMGVVVVDSVEDEDVLLLFLPLGVGGGVFGTRVAGLPPVADPDDVDASAASEAVGRVWASDATRVASCAAVHALASLTLEDFLESFWMKEPSCGGLFLPPFLPMMEILLDLKVLGVLLSSRLSTAGGCRRNMGISWTRIFRPLSRDGE
jgi:hypothetical protein